MRCFRLPFLQCLPLLVILACACLRAAPAEDGVDVLVYTNGDRVHGKFVSRENNTIIFESQHFGRLKVPATDARVLTAVASASRGTSTTTVSRPKDSPAEIADHNFFDPTDWRMTSLTETIRHIFGQWHGRLSFASSSTINEKEHKSFVVETKLTRKWTRDEVRIDARYDYASDDDDVSRDIFKSDSYWRHELSPRFFTLYSPNIEWDRDYTTDTGLDVDYLLLQQQLGVGINLITRGDQRLRVGVAENLFDLWVLSPIRSHTASNTESIFFESELTLPYRIAVTDRGSLFYAFGNGGTGWENQLEISKKLTETLSLGMRHEVRLDTPGIDVSNYTLWRFMVGLDF